MSISNIIDDEDQKFTPRKSICIQNRPDIVTINELGKN